MMMMTIRLILLQVLLLQTIPTIHSQIVAIPLLDVSGFVDSEFCYNSLIAADINQDNLLQQDEFVTFSQTVSPPGLIDHVTTFDDLPFAYTSTYRNIACLCQVPSFGGDQSLTECCTGSAAVIRIPSSKNNNDEDLAYLYATCYLTQGAAQSILESPNPTVAPTNTPTVAPTTAVPTIQPTLLPTTVEPTLLPTTVEPTLLPTTPTTPTTPTPSAPTTPPKAATAIVTYDIAVTDPSIATEAYLSDLNVAMDALAESIFTPQGRLLLLRRQLADVVTLQRPSSFQSIIEKDCPTDLEETIDLTDSNCFTIESQLTLISDDPNYDLNAAAATLEADLVNAIFDGALQQEIDALGSPLIVLTGLSSSSSATPRDDDGALSSGATAGIAVGAVLIVLVGAMLVARRTNAAKDEDDKIQYREYHGADESNSAPGSPRPKSSIASDMQTDAAQLVVPGIEKMGHGQDLVAEPGMDDDDEDSSSNAGSSGWSSSAGVSSMNTGSVDDSMDAALAEGGATLAALGVGSALSRRIANAGGTTSDDASGTSAPSATREQLDDLIEAGDWAAVGATAALLAAASDSQSASSRSRATTRSGASSDLDAARAAELDQLVDAGDWEGVVLAAARFQSADASKSAGSAGGTSGSAASTGTGDSYTGTGTGEASTTLSDSPSKTAKREEIRSEVEALVRRVVPEEIDNIDEMMKQFKGREEELVETLRTMQERAVAQKARAAGHKAAKVKAKQSVQRGVVPSAGGVAAIAAAAASDAEKTKKRPPSPKETRSALELAIESGDWEAVGQAAAMMEEGSVDTVSTGELDRIADASVSDSEGSFTRDRTHLSGVNADRAKQLDAMIDVGDWKGVISAANQFSASDRKGQMSKEEEEALKEAEAWMKIAQETKAGANTDAGASDATEWAIQRSLTQMKEAEKKKPASKGDEDEV